MFDLHIKAQKEYRAHKKIQIIRENTQETYKEIQNHKLVDMSYTNVDAFKTHRETQENSMKCANTSTISKNIK